MVDKVASPPYDVLSSAEARQMAADNPYTFLHVVKAEIDLPEDADVHGEEVYRRSAANFAKMREEGIFIQDETPCFYIYQLRMGDHVQKGIALGASVEEYESGTIKKHELTRREKEDDRARHVEILQANAGPVLFTYRAQDAIRDIIERISAELTPEYDFVAADGIGHTVWVASDPTDVEALVEAFGAVDALYVADGHHRSASAFRVRNIMRANNPNHTGEEAYNFFLAVCFPDDELKIMGYHRTVQDLNGNDTAAFLAKVAEKFDVVDAATEEPAELHRFGMFLDGTWYNLIAKEGTFDADDPVKSLDASILQENLLNPILGIEDPRTDNRIDFIGGIRGSKELVRRCNLDMKVAFSLAPVTVEQIMAIADANAIMPPKSTWFEPKLRSGLFVHTF